MKKLFFFAFAMCIGCRTINVHKTSTDDEGVIYKLPKTQLQIEIEVKIITYTKSDCFDKMKDNFKGKVDQEVIDKLAKDGVFRVAKISNYDIIPRAIEDVSKIYTIETDRRLLQDRTFGFSFDDRGFLSKADFSSDDQTLPLVSQIISSAASFVNPFTAARAAKVEVKEADNCFIIYNDLNSITAKKREFLTLDKFAIGGAELPSKEIYEKALLELEKIENDLFGQLLFTTEIKTEKLVLRYIPNNGIVDNKHVDFHGKVFSFDPATTDADGKVIKPKFTINATLIPDRYALASSGLDIIFEHDESKIKDKFYSLNLDGDGLETDEIASIPNNTTDNDGGLFYNLPVRCQVYITNTTRKKVKQVEIDLPQWGAIGRLSKKMSKLNVVTNPLTGALVSVSGETKGLSAEQIKELGASFEKARDVFYTDDLTKIDKKIQRLEKQAKLDSFEDSELKQLQADKELLTEKKNILELKNAIKKLQTE